MPLCSYVVIPETGRAPQVGARLSSLPGCEVAHARNRDVLLLVTETASAEQEEALRRSLDGLPDVRALVLAFGDLETGVQRP
jgi:nitrate reductase NapAB chaperone NapD